MSMKNSKISQIRVAILATDGFEQSELMEPMRALKEAGARVDVVSIEGGSIRGWKDKDWGDSVPVDLTLNEAHPDDYQALVLPGGLMNPDTLRSNTDAVRFASAFTTSGKPIAAICHGPQLLIETGILRGRTVTSYPSLVTDLMNAGAHWVDEPVVTDMGLVTSRKPADLPVFCKKMIEEFAEGPHDRSKMKGDERGSSRDRDSNRSIQL